MGTESCLEKVNGLHLEGSSVFARRVLTLAVVVYGIPLSNPLPRAANHRAQPMLSSSTEVRGRINCATRSVLNHTSSATQYHCMSCFTVIQKLTIHNKPLLLLAYIATFSARRGLFLSKS